MKMEAKLRGGLHIFTWDRDQYPIIAVTLPKQNSEIFLQFNKNILDSVRFHYNMTIKTQIYTDIPTKTYITKTLMYKTFMQS